MADNTENESTTTTSNSIFSSIKKEIFYIAVAAIIAIIGVILYNKHMTKQYKEILSNLEKTKETIVRELDVIDQKVNESKAKLDDINKTSNQNVVDLIKELSSVRKEVAPVEIETDEDIQKYLDMLARQSNAESNISR